MSKNTLTIGEQPQGSDSPAAPPAGFDKATQPGPTGPSRLRIVAGLGAVLLAAWNLVAAAHAVVRAADQAFLPGAGFVLMWTVPACLASGIVLITKHRSGNKLSPLLVLTTATVAFLCHAYLIYLQIPGGVIGGLHSAAVMTLAALALTRTPAPLTSIQAPHPTRQNSLNKI
jgi:hypothetical protein